MAVPHDGSTPTSRRLSSIDPAAGASGGARRPAKRSELVAAQIMAGIVDEDLPPGSRLPGESRMLEQYAVGRATLREALRILEVHGLISIKPGPNGGPVVQGAHPASFGRMSVLFFHPMGATFRDLAEARQALEPLIARMAARNRSNERKEELVRSATSVDRDGVTDDRSWSGTVTEFHAQVASMSGNPVLDLVSQSLREIWVERVTGSPYPPEVRSEVVSQHEEIAEAIRDGDAERAEALMRAHMDEFVGYLVDRHPGVLDEVVTWS